MPIKHRLPDVRVKPFVGRASFAPGPAPAYYRATGFNGNKLSAGYRDTTRASRR